MFFKEYIRTRHQQKHAQLGYETRYATQRPIFLAQKEGRSGHCMFQRMLLARIVDKDGSPLSWKTIQVLRPGINFNRHHRP